MTLDRDGIARKFSVSRRGYDPAEVDAHLAALADQIEELERSSRDRTDTLAATASEQVRAIIEAAEASAAEIHRDAEKNAQEIRGEAQVARGEARAQAREYVGRVSDSTAGMLERLDALQSDLNSLIESVRGGATRLHASLRRLEGSLDQVREATEPEAKVERRSPAPVAASREAPPLERDSPAPVGASHDAPPLERDSPAPVGASDDAPPLERYSPAPVAAPVAPPQDTNAQAPEKAHGDALAGDHDDARLIALNMALGGSPREEVERYLEQNFELDDRRALVDEVYATVEG